MKSPILHILKKDWRRVRVAVAFLLGALLLKAWLIHYSEFYTNDYIQPNLSDPSMWDFQDYLDQQHEYLLSDLVGLAGYADYIALITLIVWVLSEDPPLGDRTFWRTRPLSGTQVFAAKLIFILLAAFPIQILLQMLLTATTSHTHLSMYHISATDGLDSVLEVNAFLIGFLILGRVLWKQALLGYGILFGTFIGTVVALDHPGMMSAIDMEERQFFMMRACLAAFCFAMVIAWLMYATRRRDYGFVLFAVGIIAVTMLFDLSR